MDEFGVLVQSIGFKGQRNSTPLADLKNKRIVNPQKDSIFNNNSNNLKPTRKSFGDSGDGFGEFKSGVDGFDLESVFNVSSGSKSIYANDDIFGVFPAQKSSDVVNDDFFPGFGGFGTGLNGPGKKSGDGKTGSNRGFDDLMAGFGGKNNVRNSEEIGRRKTGSSRGFDDLMAGFGGKNNVRNRENTGKIRPPPPSGDSVKPVFSSAGDPFIDLEQPSSQDFTSGNNSKPKPQDVSKRSTFSSVDDFDIFDMDGRMNNSSHQSDPFQNDNAANDFDYIFNSGSQSTNISRTKSTLGDPVLDSLFGNKKSTSMEDRGGPTMRKTPGTSTSKKEATSRNISVDDFLFFGEATSSSDVFQEVKGESEERRKARLSQHMKTQERMAKALAEKNQRDFRTQQEQEEKHRVAETMSDNIKRWAAGKEGNLRALLSSLQHVLWPECGWQPVSLTDLITSVSVKKVYFKATLCVHPDKVQQKGASVQQKYIAEKVFDLLKEAWNKFNAEELR